MKKYFLIILFISFACSLYQIGNRTNSYDRKDWRHWSDTDRNCLNTRAEILKSRSLVPVKFNKKGCSVKDGKWADYYYPEFHFKAKNVDIDHLIPLKHAHESGGASWGLDEKERFANDPDNLVITNRVYNRQKGAKTIAEWLPVHKNYACKYIKDWFKLKKKYSLQVKPDELKTAASINCN